MIRQDRLSGMVWGKVSIGEEGSCWDWTACKDKRGYGRFWYQNKLRPATHMIWLLIHGKIPCRFPDGEVIAHKCDNPSCCNPAHLFLTTQSGNMKDAANKRRLWNQNRPGVAAGLTLAKKLQTHCVRGHPLSGDNLKIVGKRKMRRCAECFRKRDREAKRAIRAASRKGQHDFAAAS